MTSKNPIIKLKKWSRDAVKHKEAEPTAMTLATLSNAGKLKARTVLFKGFYRGSLCFFTNYQSHKAKELAKHSHAALVFFWPKQGRQIRIEGRISRLPYRISDQYWSTRPRMSQLGAWASKQSQPLSSRSLLMKRILYFENKFAKSEVPRPPYWGGFYLKPQRLEFWQAQPDRLHVRQEYFLKGGNWRMRLLYP